MRIVSFFDGAQSETTPTIGNIKASGLIEYADDAAYEASEQGSPAEGNIYFNTTSNLIRYYNGASWIDVVDRETAQTIDNKTIDGGSGGTNTVTTIADNVEVTPVGNLASTNAQDALEELQGDVNALDSRLDTAESDIIDLQTNKENKSEKGVANGYAPLDAMNLIPAIHIPGFTDDVLEFANVAAFPVTGETGKIYIAIDTNFQYRWTGSIYVQLSNSPVNTVNGQTGIVVLDLDDINDVNAPTPSNNDVLTYDNGTNEWINAAVPRALDDLTDVVLTAPITTQVLTYNGSQWVNANSGTGSLDDLSDVIISGAAAGQLLEYNGTNWVNKTFSAPTVQRFTFGSGTYTPSANVKYIMVEMIGGGGGSGGGGTAGGTNGGNGGNTTFGGWTAGGGIGGAARNGGGGAGGPIVIGAGTVLISSVGNQGQVGTGNASVAIPCFGGTGGCGLIGGGSQGGAGATSGQPSAATTGGGAGGGGSSIATNGNGGVGGGSGGYLKFYHAATSQSYSVGTGGTAGTAGTNGGPGAVGGSGLIVITEYYQ